MERSPRSDDAGDAATPHRHGHAPHGHAHGDDGRGGHGHDHGALDHELVTSARALRAVKLSALGLGFTALAQLAIVVFAGSVALLSDGLHNLGDVLGTLTLLVAFTVAQRPARPGYSFGWRRAEDLGGLVIILAIAASAVLAGYESVEALLGPGHEVRNPPWAFAAALLGAVGNEAVARYKIGVGRDIDSPALVADGQHARTDTLASAGAAVGIAGAWLGYPVLDPVAGLGITAAIVWILVDVGRDVVRRLLDAVDPALLDRLTAAAAAVEGVVDVHDVRARQTGRALLVQLHAEVDGDLSLRRAHAIAEEVRHAVLHTDDRVAAVDVHLDPAGDDTAHQATAHHS